MVKLETRIKAVKIHLAAAILDKLQKKGVESKHNGERVLKVLKETDMLNLDSGRYLTEITQDNLIDNCGYTYSHNVLPLEELCEVIDNL